MSEENNIYANPTDFHAELAKIQAAEPVKEARVEPEPLPIDVRTLNPNDAQRGPTEGRDHREPANYEDDTGSTNLEEQQALSEESNTDVIADKKKDHMIPKSRLDKEAEKRKEAEERYAKTHEENIRLQTQMQMFAALQQNQANQANNQVEQSLPKIDPLDPEAYNSTQNEIAKLRAELQQTRQQSEQTYIHNQVLVQEQLFSQNNPDFKDALEHVKNVQLEVAKMSSSNENQAQEEVANYMRNLVLNSVKNGRNAAETIYNVAKTMGYKNETPVKAAKTAGPKVNLDALSRNQERTATSADLNSPVGIGAGIPDIESCLNEYGAVDTKLFHKALERAKTIGMRR